LVMKNRYSGSLIIPSFLNDELLITVRATLTSHQLIITMN
jgi:hypothetical protein